VPLKELFVVAVALVATMKLQSILINNLGLA
jgi:hypothetical protein